MTRTLGQVLPELRRPFTPAAVKWKIQTNPDGKRPAIIVGYLDARLVSERLNAVCPGDWGHVFTPMLLGQGYAVASCRLTVLGQTREDVGWAKGVGSDMDAKTAPSDALKRAAVHFGIGAFLYAMPRIVMWANELEQSGNGKFRLGDQQNKALAVRYETWVSHPQNAKRFGVPMDHGDQGQNPGPPVPAPVEG